MELLQHLTPTAEERRRRLRVVGDVRRTLRRVGLHAVIYGSLCTGLIIPTSDIDLVMMPIGETERGASGDSRYHNHGGGGGAIPPALQRTLQAMRFKDTLDSKERKLCFASGVRAVANAIRSSGLFRNVLTIAHAKVPIVKCTHRDEDIHIDLSFEKDGCTTSRFLCDEFRRPGNELARALTILVKALIADWGLDDPSKGGLGSFPTALLVLFYLQVVVAAKYPDELRGSIGVVLSGFLKYYGKEFDFRRNGIDYVRRTLFDKPPNLELFVVNPVKPGTNCAKAATLFPSLVVRRFNEASDSFCELLDPHTTTAATEKLLQRFFRHTVPDCVDWRRVRQGAQRTPRVAQHLWDAETSMYVGGVMDVCRVPQ